jgi:carboxypeptidase PM20D1
MCFAAGEGRAIVSSVKLVRVVGTALLVVLAFCFFKTFRRSAAPRAIGAVPRTEAIDEAAVAEHLSAAIRFKTVSNQDPKDDDRSLFAGFRAFLEATYPKVHATLGRELVNGDGLLYRWQGTDPSAAPVLFLAHQDVVPVEPGTESKWTHPPFDGVIAEGFIWGRGAIDDKGSLIGLFEAFESLIQEGWKPTRTIFFASGFDEEVGGREGARRISEELAKRGLEFAWVLDEGGSVTQGIVPGVDRPVASICVSEKGYLSVEIIASAEGGHSSMPPAETAVGILAAAIDRLQKHPFAPRMTRVLRQNLETIAPEMPFVPRFVLSNLWLSSSLVAGELGKRQETNPMVRTTIAPTILEAGIKDNVLPSTARAVVNFRILPGDSIDGVLRHVVTVVGDDHVTVSKLERTLSEPAPESSTEGPGFATLVSTVHAFFPDAVVVPGVVYGATDSRHFHSVASDVYRFVPRTLSKSDLKRIHGTDERVGVADMALEVRAYRRIVIEGAR